MSFQRAKVKYLTSLDVIAIHYLTIDSYFSEYREEDGQYQRGIKSVSLFESALYCPQQTFDKKELYPDILLKAAAYLRSFACNHAFHNGNKRTALMCMIMFLKLNGYEVIASHEKLMRLVKVVVLYKPKVESIKNKYLKKYTKLAPRGTCISNEIREHNIIMDILTGRRRLKR